MQRQFNTDRSVVRRIAVVALLVVFCASGTARAQSSDDVVSEQQAASQRVGLQPVDWALIVIYACSTIGLGVYFSRRQRSMADYFTGSGNMNPLLVGVSLFATLLSTISYLSMPGEALGKGPVNLVAMLSLPLVFFIVGHLMLPVYMRYRVTSAYELLEERLGPSIRLLGASMFLALRLVWMTLLVYLAAKAMTVMLGVDPKWIPLIVAITGLVSVIYTSLGGLQAVVITDFLQTVLLFGGALLVVITVTWDFGGFGWFPTSWHPNWDTQPLLPVNEAGRFSPQVRVSVIGSILSSAVWYIATLGGDQTAVQRFMATSDARSARRALATQLTVGCIVGLTLFAVGFALLGYFEVHADQLPDGMNLKDDADKMFPHYIAFNLPPGVSGLVVAAMFAAAMSSIDSGVNSVTAVVLRDFLGRTNWRPRTEQAQLRFAKVLAFSIGVIVVFGSSFMKYIEGNITEVTNKTVNLLAVPIFGLFFFALFVRNAKPLAVWIGAIASLSTAVVIAFSAALTVGLAQFDVAPELFGVELMEDPETGQLTTGVREVHPQTGQTELVYRAPISFQWMAPMSLIVNIVIGTAANMLLSRKEK